MTLPGVGSEKIICGFIRDSSSFDRPSSAGCTYSRTDRDESENERVRMIKGERASAITHESKGRGLRAAACRCWRCVRRAGVFRCSVVTNAANWPTAASPFRKDLVPPSVHPSSVQRVSVVPTRHIKHGSTSETPSSPRSLRAETNYGSKRRQRQGNDRVLNLQDPKLPPESLAGKCSVNFSVFSEYGQHAFFWK